MQSLPQDAAATWTQPARRREGSRRCPRGQGRPASPFPQDGPQSLGRATYVARHGPTVQASLRCRSCHASLYSRLAALLTAAQGSCSTSRVFRRLRGNWHGGGLAPPLPAILWGTVSRDLEASVVQKGFSTGPHTPQRPQTVGLKRRASKKQTPKAWPPGPYRQGPDVRLGRRHFQGNNSELSLEEPDQATPPRDVLLH